MLNIMRQSDNDLMIPESEADFQMLMNLILHYANSDAEELGYLENGLFSLEITPGRTKYYKVPNGFVQEVSPRQLPLNILEADDEDE